MTANCSKSIHAQGHPDRFCHAAVLHLCLFVCPALFWPSDTSQMSSSTNDINGKKSRGANEADVLSRDVQHQALCGAIWHFGRTQRIKRLAESSRVQLLLRQLGAYALLQRRHQLDLWRGLLADALLRAFVEKHLHELSVLAVQQDLAGPLDDGRLPLQATTSTSAECLEGCSGHVDHSRLQLRGVESPTLEVLLDLPSRTQSSRG